MHSDKAILFKNTFMLYIMTAAKFILPVVIAACLTRRLGPDNYGIVTYVAALMNYFVLLFDFGFNYSATKIISQNRDNHELVQHTINNVFSAKLMLVGIGLAAFVLITPFIEILRNNIGLTFFYFASTAANVFLPDFLYRGIEKMEFVTIRYVIAKLIATGLIFVCVRGGSQMIWIPVCYTIGTVVAALYTLRHMKKTYSYTMKIARLSETIAEIKTSFIYFLSIFTTTALSAFNTLIMGIVNMPTAQIAYWSVAFQVIQAVQAMYDPITSSVYPHVVANKDYKYVIKIIKILTIGVTLGCIVLYFIASPVIRILSGTGYEAAIPVLRLLIPMLLFSFWAQMLGFPLLAAMGRQKQVTISTIVAAIYHMACILLLVMFNAFSLENISIVRDTSEFVLFFIRFIFVLFMIRQLNKVSERDSSSSQGE